MSATRRVSASVLISCFMLVQVAEAADLPAIAHAELSRVIALARQGQVDEAKRICSRGIRRGKGGEDAHWFGYGLAVIHHLQGDLRKAFRQYQNVANHLPALRERANDRQLEICISLMSPEQPDGMHPGKPSPKWVKDMLEEVLYNDPTALRAAKLYYYLGLYYEQNRQPDVAKVYYGNSSGRDPGGSWYDRSFFAVARIYVRTSQAAPRHIGLALEARAILESYLAYADAGIYQEAAGHMLESTVRHIHENAFRQARFYDRKMYPVSATLTAYRNFLEAYPDAEQASVARQRLDQLVALRSTHTAQTSSSN